MGVLKQPLDQPEIQTRMGVTTLREEDYSEFAKIMLEKAGVNLDRSKMSMMQARLVKRLHALGLASFQEYRLILKENPDELHELINTLTTHKTDFFREPEHFRFLQETVIPDVLTRKRQRLLLWSAACSTGEEVYTLAINLEDWMSRHPGTSFDYGILGTDIDTNVVARAEEGIYNSELVAAVPSHLVPTWFEKGKGQHAGTMRVKEALRKHLKFRYYNLMDPVQTMGNMKFDIIFLRNVLIYFKDATRYEVMEKMRHFLVPGGYLFVGHSESFAGGAPGFRSVSPAVYQKV